MPTSNNQGWSQMPFGNVNEGPPIYSGQVPNWDININNARQMVCNHPGHMKPNCPNAKASVDCIPLCGNCNQASYTVEQCNVKMINKKVTIIIEGITAQKLN